MKTSTKKFVVCLKNKGYEVSLEHFTPIDLPQPVRKAVLASV